MDVVTESMLKTIKAYNEFRNDIRHIVLDLAEHEMERATWQALNDLERKLEKL